MRLAPENSVCDVFIFSFIYSNLVWFQEEMDFVCTKYKLIVINFIARNTQSAVYINDTRSNIPTADCLYFVRNSADIFCVLPKTCLLRVS